MNLDNLKNLLNEYGCKTTYVKKLAPNDNSKNQVYLGGSFDILNIFPISEIISVPAGDWKKDRFKASINFFWVTEDRQLSRAAEAQLILYPKYPEVRFSGFLKGCSNAPSNLMASRAIDRFLFLSVTNDGRVLGYVVDSKSELYSDFLRLTGLRTHGVFSIIDIENHLDNRKRLLSEMLRIHQLGWIDSKMLNPAGEIIPCQASHCGGYTLEAELGVTPNGFAEPDYYGYEIKQFHARSFEHYRSEILTLMTPEPTDGFYVKSGVEAFVRKYGYADKNGIPDRLNFGGIHKVGDVHSLTNLKLELIGFDIESGKIKNSDGKICLIDLRGEEAASWSFASLLKHWNRKHNLACYVPSQNLKEPHLQYRYGNKLILGSGTNFILFLKQMNLGNIYYDPGIKLENASTKPKTKRRSQFRIRSGFLKEIYYKSEDINLLNI
jgi:hypothetical protein